MNHTTSISEAWNNLDGFITKENKKRLDIHQPRNWHPDLSSETRDFIILGFSSDLEKRKATLKFGLNITPKENLSIFSTT